MATILFNHPIGSKSKSGAPFYTNPKRPPKVIEYDSSNETILEFIHSAANIFAFIYNLKEISKEECRKICDEINVPKFVP